MKVGMISDLHGYPDRFIKAMKLLQDCDMVLCAGDILYHGPRNPILDGYDPLRLSEEIKMCSIPMLMVQGNCDAQVDAMVLGIPSIPSVAVYDNNSTRFMLMHGHDIEFEKLKEYAKICKVNVMVTGHTHIRMLKQENGIIFINPGSLGVPKGDGQPSAVIYEDGKAAFINIDTGIRINV